MIALQYKLYSNAKRGALDAQIDAFGELQNYSSPSKKTASLVLEDELEALT